MSGWGRAVVSTLLKHLLAASSEPNADTRNAVRGPAAEAAAALVAVACVSREARAAVAASASLDQVLYHLGVGKPR